MLASSVGSVDHAIAVGVALGVIRLPGEPKPRLPGEEVMPVDVPIAATGASMLANAAFEPRLMVAECHTDHPAASSPRSTGPGSGMHL